MNFNLSLLPNFFIPIAISILIGVIFVLIYSIIDKRRANPIFDKFNFEKNRKTEVLNYLIILSIPFALIILFLGWILPDLDFIIFVLLGGIPLVFILPQDWPFVKR